MPAEFSSAVCSACQSLHVYIHPIITICTASGICCKWAVSICWSNFLRGICIDHFFMQSFCIDHFNPQWFLIGLDIWRAGRGLRRKEAEDWGESRCGGGGGKMGRDALFHKTPPVFLICSDPTQPLFRTPAQAMPFQIFIVCLYTWAGSSWLMERPRNEGKWGVVISQATGDCSSELRTWEDQMDNFAYFWQL